jgi:hypothetical protein
VAVHPWHIAEVIYEDGELGHDEVTPSVVIYDAPGCVCSRKGPTAYWDWDADFGARPEWGGGECPMRFEVNEVGIETVFDGFRDDADWIIPGWYRLQTWIEIYPGGPWGPTEADAGVAVEPLPWPGWVWALSRRRSPR